MVPAGAAGIPSLCSSSQCLHQLKGQAGEKVSPFYTRARTAGSSADVWKIERDESEEKWLNQILTMQSTGILEEGMAENWTEGNT